MAWFGVLPMSASGCVAAEIEDLGELVLANLASEVFMVPPVSLSRIYPHQFDQAAHGTVRPGAPPHIPVGCVVGLV